MTIPLAVLAGHEAGSGTLERGGVVAPEVARRLGCDATVVAAAVDSLGVPLAVGRSMRTVPPALQRALELRDGGCAFPPCDRPVAWTEAHHVRPWAAGGTTELDNLVLLCRHHHRPVHHHGWQVRIGPSLLPQFRPPWTVNAGRPWIASVRRQ